MSYNLPCKCCSCMSDNYTIKTITEESIGVGTVTTTFQVPLCKACEEAYKSHKTIRLLIRIATIILGFIIGNIIAPIFTDGDEGGFIIGIVAGVIAGMIAAHIYKIRNYPFRMDSIQQLHFKNKEYQQLFEQANRREQ